MITITPDPFSWELFVPNKITNPNWQYFLNDPTMEGVQTNVRLGGDSQAWATTDRGFDNTHYTIGLVNNPAQTVTWADYGLFETATYLDLDDYMSYFKIDNPTVLSRYTDLNQTPNGGAVTTGLKVYPGVSSIFWSGSSYDAAIQVGEYGRPISFETWFSHNESRTNLNLGYSGYTLFSEQTTPFPSLTPLGNPGEHIRKYCAGIFKVDADISNPQVSDVLCGVIVEGTSSGAVGQIIIDGQVVRAETLTQAATELWFEWSGLFEGDPALLGGKTGTIDYIWFKLNTFNVTLLSSQYRSFDSKDVKFGWYVDRNTGLSEGTYVGTLRCYPPSMFTHPSWPVTVVITEDPVEEVLPPDPSRRPPSITDVRFFTEADPYYYTIDNRPLKDLSIRDLDILNLLKPLTSIENTPVFLGQKALIENLWYLAVGIESSEDWVPINPI